MGITVFLRSLVATPKASFVATASAAPLSHHEGLRCPLPRRSRLRRPHLLHPISHRLPCSHRLLSHCLLLKLLPLCLPNLLHWCLWPPHHLRPPHHHHLLCLPPYRLQRTHRSCQPSCLRRCPQDGCSDSRIQPHHLLNSLKMKE